MAQYVTYGNTLEYLAIPFDANIILVGAASYVMNFIAAFSLLVTKGNGAGSTFGLALMIMLIGIPVSFVFWYRNLYNGVKRDRSINCRSYLFLSVSIHTNP